MRSMLFLVFAFGVCTAIPACASSKGLDLKITKILPSGLITVMMTNSGTVPLKLWDGGNGWGAARWRLVVISKNGVVQTYYQNPDENFTRNFPGASDVASGAHVERALDLNDSEWCIDGQCPVYDDTKLFSNRVRLDADDTVDLIYDVPKTQEAIEMHVWYGVAAVSAKVSAQ